MVIIAQRSHGRKSITVSLPDGLIGFYFSHASGRRHDSYVHRISGLEESLSSLSQRLNRLIHVYGDPAFALRPSIQVGWRPTALATVCERAAPPRDNF